MKFNQIS